MTCSGQPVPSTTPTVIAMRDPLASGVINGTPAAAANPLLDARDKARRVRQLINQISARQPRFRGALYAQRRDLGELVKLTGTDGSNVFARMDALDADIKSLLYWASGGAYDAHATASKPSG
jgi:hypothetical protein